MTSSPSASATGTSKAARSAEIKFLYEESKRLQWQADLAEDAAEAALLAARPNPKDVSFAARLHRQLVDANVDLNAPFPSVIRLLQESWVDIGLSPPPMG
jgi:hypothetical protein